MLIALTGGQKAGILVVAGIFIAFALASSFLFTRGRPDFPGRRGLPYFVLATIALFVAMMAAMVVFAKEDEEEGRAEPAATETAPPTGTAEEEPAGDAQAGAEVFASAGCGGCHILQAAGTSGAVGPNLDESQPAFELVVDRVTNGQGVMPSFKDQLSEEQIRNVAAYVVASTK